METKGHVVNKPLMFKGQNYDCWKQRMMTFFDTCHINMSIDSKFFMERITKDKVPSKLKD
ncbi:hypothetical protein CR513_58559, partial [Mucuna pruriens]